MTTSHSDKASAKPRVALPFKLLKKKTTFSRRHQRYDCVVIGSMKVIDIGAEFEGAVLEVSCGGCVFRQASMFVLDRLGESVLVRTDFFEAEGRIRAVRPDGYGIQFFQEVDELVISQVVRECSGKVADSSLAKRN